MTYEQFVATLTEREPPRELPDTLRALWYDRQGRGDWARAHSLVEPIDSAAAAWVHAYLHRREGDRSNAAYWYRRAGQPFPSAATLEEEWAALVDALLRGMSGAGDPSPRGLDSIGDHQHG